MTKKRACNKCEERNISIKAYVSDIRDLKIPEQKYSLIVAAGASLNFLKKSEMEEVITRMKRGVKTAASFMHRLSQQMSYFTRS